MAKKRTAIDPITRIEGHLRAELEVEDGVVTDAWVSGGCFRGMELAVEDRTPEDAAQIVQRICGVCPVSHAHASTIAAEHTYGIQIPNAARIIRNITEGAQFLHSHILWLYNLCALDYVNPIHGLEADPKKAERIAESAGTSTNTDFKQLKLRLQKFAKNGQLSIFSGNWFGSENGKGYKLPAEVDLVLTAHYLEALTMQAKASEVAGLIGGKMPHIMTAVPGGTMWVPTEEKLDDLWGLVNELYDWCSTTVLQDTLILAQYYSDAFKFGKGCGRYIAWGVFDAPSFEMNDRYLPAGVIGDDFKVQDVDEDKITEWVGHSWYEGDSDLNPREGETKPLFTEYNTDDRYTWSKAPRYDGQCMEAGGLSRLLVAYLRGNSFVTKQINSILKTLDVPLTTLLSTLGRTAARQVETVYIAGLMKDWTQELISCIKEGDTETFIEHNTNSGDGTGFWEAPRGALYHTEHVSNGKITGYQIIIPTTWNIAPHNENGEPGPMESALIGVPVDDMDMPINALRTVHSFDPCTACAVHITEPSTGRHFDTVTNPWGVK
ncbi:MAG: nickel-dependent hydrogenase large subunit [Eggerthellaceae bacterium]|jgi:[NiFe] hydrogenase large subunit